MIRTTAIFAVNKLFWCIRFQITECSGICMMAGSADVRAGLKQQTREDIKGS